MGLSARSADLLQLTDAISLGVGGRYWHFESKGLAHFEALFPNAVPPPLDLKANLYGVFVQGSYRFDALSGRLPGCRPRCELGKPDA